MSSVRSQGHLESPGDSRAAGPRGEKGVGVGHLTGHDTQIQMLVVGSNHLAITIPNSRVFRFFFRPRRKSLGALRLVDAVVLFVTRSPNSL